MKSQWASHSRNNGKVWNFRGKMEILSRIMHLIALPKSKCGHWNLIEYQLRSTTYKEELVALQGINHSVYNEIDPLRYGVDFQYTPLMIHACYLRGFHYANKLLQSHGVFLVKLMIENKNNDLRLAVLKIADIICNFCVEESGLQIVFDGVGICVEDTSNHEWWVGAAVHNNK